jgi:hypothetical protein
MPDPTIGTTTIVGAAGGSGPVKTAPTGLVAGDYDSLLDGRATLRPNCGHAPSSATADARRPTANDTLGVAMGVSGVSITRRGLALSPSSCGGRGIKRQIARWRTHLTKGVRSPARVARAFRRGLGACE